MSNYCDCQWERVKCNKAKHVQPQHTTLKTYRPVTRIIICPRGLRSLTWVDTLRRVHNDVFFSRGTARIATTDIPECTARHVYVHVIPESEIINYDVIIRPGRGSTLCNGINMSKEGTCLSDDWQLYITLHIDPVCLT